MKPRLCGGYRKVQLLCYFTDWNVIEVIQLQRNSENLRDTLHLLAQYRVHLSSAVMDLGSMVIDSSVGRVGIAVGRHTVVGNEPDAASSPQSHIAKVDED